MFPWCSPGCIVPEMALHGRKEAAMDQFQLVSDYTPSGDQPEAIIPDFKLCGTTIAEEAINQGKSPEIMEKIQ